MDSKGAHIQEAGRYWKVTADAMFGSSDCRYLFERLDDGMSGVLLDLRAVMVIKPNLLAHIAAAWPWRSDVPRLGIVLSFDSWAVLQDAASLQLQPFTDRGVAVAIFYSQQAESVPRWFAGEEVPHDVPAVVAWLTTAWRSTALWPMILSVAARLVEEFSDIATAPSLLVDLSAIALSFGKDGSASAREFAEKALCWLGDSRNPARCRAWTALATVSRNDGDTAAALGYLEQAIAVAIRERYWTEAARALAESGVVLLGSGYIAQAERRFRQALVCLSTEADPKLRVLLHDNLLLAVHESSRRDRQAIHAVGAELSAVSAVVDAWSELIQPPPERERCG